jgi:hypothetical protein
MPQTMKLCSGPRSATALWTQEAMDVHRYGELKHVWMRQFPATGRHVVEHGCGHGQT